MSKRSSEANALLNLSQKAPAEPSSSGLPMQPASPAPKPPNSAVAAMTIGGTGRRTQVFLHEADRKIIRELLAYLAGHGKRVSESLVIKAALRAAKPGEEFLQAYEQAAAQDQRFKSIKSA